MSWVDLVIAVAVAIAGLRGYAEGALRQVARFIGLGVGFVVGTMVAPSLSSDVTHALWRPALAIGVVLAASLVGGVVGRRLGGIAATGLHALKLGVVDRVVGVAVGVVGALLSCWLMAGLVNASTWGSLATGIQHSGFLTMMNKVMPPLPSVEARVQSLFRNADFPTVFATVVAPTAPVSVAPGSLGPLVTSLASPVDVVKVLASGGCSSTSEGTAFFVSAHVAVTNAHVVAGQSVVTVAGAPAQVALYDPVSDIAVLRVASLDEPPLRFLSGAPAPGTRAEVIGFPLNGTRTGAPAVIEGALSGEGRDIYNGGLLERTVLAVAASIEPGNSGSPVLVGTMVAGVIESKSLSQANTAYAISDAVVRRDLARTPATGEESTQGCLP